VQTAEQYQDYAQQQDSARLGMWIFLATEILFFGVLLFVYGLSRTRYPEAFAVASRRTDVVLGTLNTAMLLTSSFTMALAVRAGELQLAQAARRWLYATAFLGAAFLTIKGIEYQKDYTDHLVPMLNFHFDAAHARGAEAFFGLYFASTAVHAFHVLIGLFIIVLFARALPGEEGVAFSSLRIEVLGLYWHFVDVVWIFLYPLLYLVSRA
jgi:cytochrome c oxidase subunit III